MHNAPPVVFPVGRFVWGRRVVWVLALCGASGLGFWQTHADVFGFKWAWAAWGLSVAAALFATTKDILTAGSLVWTGEVWLWRDAKGGEVETQLRVLLDVGSALVLVLLPVDAPWHLSHRFAWVHGCDAPQMWHGMRCAVYSRSKADQTLANQAGDPF
jgi:hypothetical protein